MKLRNKKTGEIGNLVLNINPNRESYSVLSTENGDTICGNLVLADYDSLAELNEEWEDYEEPKEYWIIDTILHEIRSLPYKNNEEDKRYEQWLEELGLKFETKEEAEKAVEKLKAWKRLKDKGFSIYSWDYEFDMVDKPAQTIILRASAVDSSNEDLDLLFGGGE